jgi:hypothetical protein
MQSNEILIPRPPVVRDRLAQSLRETRLLKRLLRLAIAATEDEHGHAPHDRQPEAVGREAKS